jgi:plastocyanin
MLKAAIRASVVAILVFDLVVGGVLGAVLGTTLFANRGPTPSASAQRTTMVPPLTTVTIAQGLELFEPFILVVHPNTTVTWQNNDAVAHTITTALDQTPFLNPSAFSFTVAAGHRVQHRVVSLLRSHDGDLELLPTCIRLSLGGMHTVQQHLFSQVRILRG